MTAADVEIVRKGVEAWNQRDAKLWLSYAAPEIEWLPAGPAAVERSVYRTIATLGDKAPESGGAPRPAPVSVLRGQAEVPAPLRRLEGLTYVEAVLWLGRVKMKGAASHVELDQEFAVRTVLRAGKVVMVQAFLAWDDALEAAGREGRVKSSGPDAKAP